MLLIDQEATLAAIPDLLPRDREVRRKAFAALGRVLSAAGEVTGEAAQRLERIAGLFGVEADAAHAAVTRPRLARRLEPDPARHRGWAARGPAREARQEAVRLQGRPPSAYVPEPRSKRTMRGCRQGIQCRHTNKPPQAKL